MAYQLGDVVGQRYRLLSHIGSGAHGEVFRARDLETRNEVAVKVLADQRAAESEYVRRIEREAVAMARLRGTSAVYVHGLHVGQDGIACLVMELLRGQNFEDYLREAEKLGGRIKANKLLEILRPIVTTLEAAHQQGIVHRDLKPSNVFVVSAETGGGVRLLDFGLAKLLDASTLTSDGMVAGTPSYIAPEAWKGDPKRLDHRIDVYSLGVIVFRALSGRIPAPSSNVLQICQWASSGARPSLHALRTNLPKAIDPWVQKALAIEPSDRFQSVREEWRELEALFKGHVSRAPY